MFNPLILDAPYGVNQFVENQLIPYQTCVGTDEMTDLLRYIQESGNYYWQGVAFPGQSDTTIGAGVTANGTLQVPAGTYVIGMTYYSSNEAGMKFKLYDKGTKASIFYGDYALDRIAASSMSALVGQGTVITPTDPGMNADNPFGPNFLLSPFIVTPPGVLGWEIVNLATASATIQVMLSCAVPINSQSINNMMIERTK